MSTARVIFVHGISGAIEPPNYAASMISLIRKNVIKANIFGKDPSDDEIAKYLTFESVNYSSIGSDAEQKVLDAYITDSRRKYNFIDRIIEQFGFFSIRKEVITSVSDVLVYESSYWREHIRDTLRDKIEPYVGTSDKVTVIGHSLGSVVSFDTLYKNCIENDKWCSNNFKVQNLFTLGSPIALFSVDLRDDTGTQKERYLSLDQMQSKNLSLEKQNNKFINDSGVWYNFFDAQDIIGYPLETLFKDRFGVVDHLVQTGTFPLTAHTNYWQNKFVAEKISERLILDIAS